MPGIAAIFHRLRELGLSVRLESPCHRTTNGDHKKQYLCREMSGDSRSIQIILYQPILFCM